MKTQMCFPFPGVVPVDAQLLEMENTSLKKKVHALSGYKGRYEHLQDMSDELANTAKGNQMLLLNAEKLQLELNSEKENIPA